ncbi:branched-chain amino acid transport system substrate-binding protein [Herbaspirillum sp. Sphag1AN]|uniref:ABC transporter substrate-binding protein n=1 Tax=unclassified Herbaspirillum TaxID=2624150 RepID=UPI00160C8C56|nr:MULTISPECIES: ABC transporter substrate-binding protein [unclassified Herbaspirillum]MBB3211839.1 branched-chain amino acid transport system substrate-binding protein [Herbaspirillum sp. Sphag1AN]MBB3244327.1 branched-chain amino acid transport system substrate-binding protein [Herbaspirillum sp. Sphag64]
MSIDFSSQHRALDRRGFLTLLTAGTAVLGLPMLAHAAGEPIRIGLLAPLTGGGGPYGEGMVNAALKAVEFINKEAGGVLGGRRLEIVVADDESNPTAGVAAARKLLDVSKVVALIGMWSSAVAMAVKPLAIERGIPLLVSGSADEVTQGDNKGLVWRFQSSGKDWGAVFGKAALKDGAKTASVLALQTPFTTSLVEPFIKTFKAGGGRIIDSVYYSPNQPSYRAEVEKIFSQKPDAVFIPSYLPDLSAVTREIYRSGYSAKIYVNSSAADAEGAFIKNVGVQVSEGIDHIQSIPPRESSAYQTFARVTGTSPDAIAIFPSNAWDEVSVLALAIEKAGSTDPQQFAKAIPRVVNGPGVTVEDPVVGLKALRAHKAIAYSGAGSSFKFAANGEQINRIYGHFTIRNGKNKLIEILQ